MNVKTFKTTDLELVREVKVGNKRAEEFLYKKYKQKLVRLLKYKKYNSFDLEDCVSEILIKIFEKINTYDEEKSSFSTWVGTITNNHLINKGKQKINSITILSYSTDDQPPITFTDTSGEITFTSNVGCTNELTISSDAVETFNINNSYTLTMLSNVVSDRDLNMLKMKYIEGYSYNEIGEHFSMTSNTVSNRVNYIKTVISKKNKNYFEK